MPRFKLKRGASFKKYKLNQAKEVTPAPTQLPKWLDNHINASTGSRIKTAMLAGAGVGAVSTLTNKQDDDVLSTGERMVKYAALGVGASYGTEVVMDKMGITSKHLAQHDVASKAKKVMTEAEELRWNKNMSRKTGVAAMIGLAAFGAATLIDGVSGLEEKRKASIERNRQEQELAQRQSAEKRRQNQMGYGYVDYGQIAIQQFEKRIGHYAMGNARFY